jgi:hypothetical protein
MSRGIFQYFTYQMNPDEICILMNTGDDEMKFSNAGLAKWKTVGVDEEFLDGNF